MTLPNVPGQLQSVYLTGQGRALDDLIAVVRRVAQDDVNGAHVETTLTQAIRLQLNGYTHNMIQLNIPTSTSRLFNTYNLEVERLEQDNGDGTFSVVGSGQNQPFVQDSFAAFYRVFPARQTSVTVRLDDSMFVTGGSGYTFDRNQFILANYSQIGFENAQMNGFLSDYVYFDISNMPQAERPNFPDASGNATAFYINGDNFAIATKPDGAADQATPDAKPFFVLTPAGYVSGLHVGPRTAVDPTTGQTSQLPGTYSLIQPDPQPVNPAGTITALQGTYKSFYKTLASLGSNPQGFEIIAFPGTRSDDDGLMDIVMFNVSGNQVTHVYFGQMDFNAGTISAFPVAQVATPENVSNEIVGTINQYVTGSGASTSDVTQIRAGHYTIDTLNSQNLPASFSTSGRFIVYRR